jgi:hypothetical protein
MIESLGKEALDRLKDAKSRKSDVQLDIRESYFFIAPSRCRDFNSDSKSSRTQGSHDGELQTSIGIEVSADFSKEVLESFMPESAEWISQRPPASANEEDQEKILEQAAKHTEIVLQKMKETNFYDEVSIGYRTDLAVGTVAMWVDRAGLGQPIATRSVPLHELEINVGPDGKIDDRFVVRHTKVRFLAAYLSRDVLEKIPNYQNIAKKEPNKSCKLVWGFWRIWAEFEPIWQGVVLYNDKIIDERLYKGIGSVPLIVSRFNPDPMFPYGEGPCRMSLPDLRRLDDMEALQISSYEFRVQTPFAYPDDGALNFSNGLEAGMGYPMRLGPSSEPKPLYFGGELNYEQWTKSDVEKHIRRLFYVDYPEQTGKTPPTAAQWLDEMAMRQSRMGLPGKSFWAEGPKIYFERFRYLLEQSGELAEIKVDGKPLTLAPYNPTEKSKDHSDVLVAERLLTMAGQFAPELSQVLIDQAETFKNIKAKMRDRIVVFRDASQVNSAIQQFAPLIQGGGGAPIEGAQP